MNKNYSSLTIGLIFILVGSGLLMDRLTLFSFGWFEIYPIIFILISTASFLNALAGQRNSAFWGGMFGVFGAFFFLRNYNLIPFYWFHEFWPIFLIALGVGFLVLYIFQPRDWGVLIPGSILTFLGLVFIFDTMALVEDIVEIVFDWVDTYWPLVFILLGAGLILDSLKKKEKSEKSDRIQQE
jgi:membrane-bound ClpP family serine protease